MMAVNNVGVVSVAFVVDGNVITTWDYCGTVVGSSVANTAEGKRLPWYCV